MVTLPLAKVFVFALLAVCDAVSRLPVCSGDEHCVCVLNVVGVCMDRPADSEDIDEIDGNRNATSNVVDKDRPTGILRSAIWTRSYVTRSDMELLELL